MNIIFSLSIILCKPFLFTFVKAVLTFVQVFTIMILKSFVSLIYIHQVHLGCAMGIALEADLDELLA